MDMVVGGFALLVGLVAVCLTIMTKQKLNRQNEELVKVHLSGVYKDLKESNKVLKGLYERLTILEKEIQVLNKTGEAVPVLKGEMEKLRSELSVLDSSIPEQFRAPQRM